MNDRKLLSIINEIYKKNGNKELVVLDENANLRNELGFDSLDLAELTVRIEDSFGIDVFQDGIVKTIKDIKQKIK